MARNNVEHGIGRRRVLVGLGAFAAALAALPLVVWWRTSRIPPLREDWGDLGSPSKLPEGRWVSRTLAVSVVDRWRQRVEKTPVVVRRTGRRIELLSAICPHEACPVNADEAGFACRCHDSRFDADGRVLGGPARSDLVRLHWRVKDGRLEGRLAAAPLAEQPPV